MKNKINEVEEEHIDELEYNALISIGELYRKLREQHYDGHKIMLDFMAIRGMIKIKVW